MSLSDYFLLVVFGILRCQAVCLKEYCYPGQSCWPTPVDIANLHENIYGTLLQPFDQGYSAAVRMRNERLMKSPGLIVMAERTEDVRQAVLFAQKFNIRLTVWSAGNDHTGRSTADGSLQVNLSRMKSVEIRLEDERHPDGTIRVEAGNTWGHVYEQVGISGRVIAGGNSVSMGVGDFISGGGQGPLSRSLGLAIDNLLAFEMVTSSGGMLYGSEDRIVEEFSNGTRYEVQGSDIFWAVRGGGDGYGIITALTFKLHIPPNAMVGLECRYQLSSEKNTESGKRVLSAYLNFLPALPPEWSGHLVTGRSNVQGETETVLSVTLLHYGPWDSPTTKAVGPLIDTLQDQQLSCQFTNVSTVYEWLQRFSDDVYYRNYFTNVFLQYDSIRPELTDFIVDSSTSPRGNETDPIPSCIFSLLGGKISEVPSNATSLSPAYRTALASLTCKSQWRDAALDDINTENMIEFGKRLRDFGRGVYYSEADQQLPTWKHDFWDPHYARLLRVKQSLDPDNIFFCPLCVGSETVGIKDCGTTSPLNPERKYNHRNDTFQPDLNDFTGRKFCSRYCSPGHPCWPSDDAVIELGRSLDGSLLTPNMKLYGQTVIMKNTLFTKHPGIVVMAKSTSDVQKAITFSRKYNIRLTVLSSGHDYNGKSTADGSLQINLSNMTEIKVNMKDERSDTGATIFAETGNVWGNLYREVEKYGRIVVGGNAQTVALGGYTTGGGHSVFSRSFGLGVDNVLEFQMVVSDGTIVNSSANGTVFLSVDGTVGKSPSKDLFWAVLGGGGGTYGVVTSFTYKLHPSPTQLVSWYCLYPANVGTDVVGRNVTNFFHSLVPNLSPKWGGYFLINEIDPVENNGTVGTISFALLHNGGWNEPSVNDVRPLMDFLKPYQLYCAYSNHTSFLDYRKNSTDPVYYRSYIFNTLLQRESFTPNLTDTLLGGLVQPKAGLYGCTGTLLGGKVSDVGNTQTSVNPALRTALSSMTCGIGWFDPKSDPVNIAAGKILGKRLYKHGKGVYYNEPEIDLPKWKSDFWGENYRRLLALKQQWDRDNVFYCHHCVGSDLVENFSCNDTESSASPRGTDAQERLGCESYEFPVLGDQPMVGPLREGIGYCSRYCLLGNPCWPSDATLANVESSFEGTGFVQSSPNFGEGDTVRKSPAVLVLPKSAADIQKAMLFGRRHNLRVAPVSSSFHGNRTKSLLSSLQVNLSNMTSVSVDMNDVSSPTGASVKVDSGATWAKIYEEVDKFGKVVVGASHSSIPVDDFTTGGGSGLLSRTLGLAADNVLKFTIVLPDGRIAEVSERDVVFTYPNSTTTRSNNTELFWAVRGGGRDTFGIISDITFALHDSPTGFVQYSGMWRLDPSLGRAMLEKFHRILPQLSPSWGGELVSVARSPQDKPNGTILVSLLHFGDSSHPSVKEFTLVNDIMPENQISSQLLNYSTFWESQKNNVADTFKNEYVFNTFLQYESDPKQVADFIVNVNINYGTCKEMLVGGKVSQARANAAAINPALRRALVSLTCSYVWDDTFNPEPILDIGEKLSQEARDLGDGVYINAAADNVTDWKYSFWGHHYERLVEVKEDVDPQYLLTCHQCVGSDMVLEFYNETYFDRDTPTIKPLYNFTTPGINPVDPVENNEYVSRYCVPGLSCWPTNAELLSLDASLQGVVLRPVDTGYVQHTQLMNKLRIKSPGLVVFPLTVADVQRAVLFAREHSLRVTVISSGHDFNGKSTADGSLQINMSKMKQIEMDLVDNRSPTLESVTAQAGASWRDIYEQINTWHRRVVVGPSSLSVSPSGYTSGGGFSPLSPSLGLAVDNTIAFQLVMADGRIVNATKAQTTIIDTAGNVTTIDDDDLFWAVRGGGGGTFGILTSLTYQLHYVPAEFVQFVCVFAPKGNAKEGLRDIVNFFHSVLKTIPREWGGNFIVSNSVGPSGDMNFAAVNLLYYGASDSPSLRAVEQIFEFRKEWQISCSYTTKNTFWDYVVGASDIPYERTYISNGLFPPDKVGVKLAETVVEQVVSPNGRRTAKTCVYDLLGGKVGEAPRNETSVNDKLRQAAISVTCSVSWSDKFDDVINMVVGREMSEALYNQSEGIYLNLAPFDLPSWKMDFWGNKYNNLLAAKKKYDPENFFYCRHCVGSDQVRNFQEQQNDQPRPKTEPKGRDPVTPASSATRATSVGAILSFVLCLYGRF